MDIETESEDLRKSMTDSGAKSISRNIVIRGLPESEAENTAAIVDQLIHKTLKLKNVQITGATRMKSHRANTPGVIVATCGQSSDIDMITSKKAKLKQNRFFADVYINKDKTLAERQAEDDATNAARKADDNAINEARLKEDKERASSNSEKSEKSEKNDVNVDCSDPTNASMSVCK